MFNKKIEQKSSLDSVETTENNPIKMRVVDFLIYFYMFCEEKRIFFLYVSGRSFIIILEKCQKNYLSVLFLSFFFDSCNFEKLRYGIVTHFSFILHIFDPSSPVRFRKFGAYI